jgi:hypothetical protein
MAASASNGDERMKRTILVALGIGVAVSSAAALDIGAARQPASAAVNDPIVHAARTRESARTEQRVRIDERYLAERERCSRLGGFQRDECLVTAHANRGRAMLETAAPYEVRF